MGQHSTAIKEIRSIAFSAGYQIEKDAENKHLWRMTNNETWVTIEYILPGSKRDNTTSTIPNVAPTNYNPLFSGKLVIETSEHPESKNLGSRLEALLTSREKNFLPYEVIMEGSLQDLYYPNIPGEHYGILSHYQFPCR